MARRQHGAPLARPAKELRPSYHPSTLRLRSWAVHSTHRVERLQDGKDQEIKKYRQYIRQQRDSATPRSAQSCGRPAASDRYLAFSKPVVLVQTSLESMTAESLGLQDVIACTVELRNA